MEKDTKQIASNMRSTDFYIQTETITLSSEVGKYPVIMNSNYKYLVGIIIRDTANSTIGLIDKGQFILDEAPLYLYNSVSSQNFSEKMIPLNTLADGTMKSLYFDKKGVVIASVIVNFVLSNIAPVLYKKRNISYDTLVLAAGANTGTIYFNNYMKKVIGYNFDQICPIPQVTQLSLSSYSKLIFNKIKPIDFWMGTVPSMQKFIPVSHSADSITYDMTCAVPGTYFIVYEYEK
jgi:hypothetical protein